MPAFVTLYLFAPGKGAIDEDEFAAMGHPPDLIGPEAEALLSLSDGVGSVDVQDGLDDLLGEICIGAARALSRGEAMLSHGIAGYDRMAFTPEGETVRITCGRDSLTLRRDETVAALKAAAGRYGVMLRAAFPDAPGRWQQLEAFAAA